MKLELRNMSKEFNENPDVIKFYCICETPKKSAADNSICKKCKKKLKQ